jgi:hypothetical protein
MGSSPQSGPNLGVVMGSDFAAKTGNLARNIRLGVLSSVLDARLKPIAVRDLSCQSRWQPIADIASFVVPYGTASCAVRQQEAL